MQSLKSIIVAATAGIALLGAQSLNAAVLQDNFESYELTSLHNKTFVDQNPSFTPTVGNDIKATIVQASDTGVNTTQVLEQASTTTNNSGTKLDTNHYLDLTGNVQFQVDFKLTGTEGTTQLYLFGNGGRPVWIALGHESTNGGTASVKFWDHSSLKSKTFENAVILGDWYRLIATAYIDSENGNTTYEATIINLSNPSEPDVSSGLLNSRDNPTNVTFPEFLSQGGAVDYFDNLRVVPEPLSLSFLTIGGLILLKRNR